MNKKNLLGLAVCILLILGLFFFGITRVPSNGNSIELEGKISAQETRITSLEKTMVSIILTLDYTPTIFPSVTTSYTETTANTITPSPTVTPTVDFPTKAIRHSDEPRNTPFSTSPPNTQPTHETTSYPATPTSYPATPTRYPTTPTSTP